MLFSSSILRRAAAKTPPALKKFGAAVLQGAANTLILPWKFADARRRKRRQAVFSGAFPEQWRRILEHRTSIYLRMPPELRRQLEGHILVFLDEKRFEGCSGQRITDEVRVTIAAQACLLVLNREARYYPGLSTILVYPSAFEAAHIESLGPAHLHGRAVNLGQSWTKDYVVLAWDSVKSGARNPIDGENVVLHEFAHQLDQEDGTADGIPILPDRSAYTAWAKILSREYEHFCSHLEKGEPVEFDDYGAVNRAEFFSVLTESFFERPAAFKQRHPELYSLLAGFYAVDPASWG